MECWLCGEGLTGEACYDVDDTQCRYPLCSECDQTCDLRLVLMEAEAQIQIDCLAEMEIGL